MIKHIKILVYLSVLTVFVVFMGFGVSHGLLNNLNSDDIINFTGVYHNLIIGNTQDDISEVSESCDGVKKNLSIQVNNLSSNYGDNVTITVKLTDKTTSQPVINKTVCISNEDLPRKEAITNSQGIAKFTYAAGCENLKPAIYKFQVISYEDSRYEYNDSYMTLNVNRANATVTVNDIYSDRAAKCTVTAVFRNKTNVPVCTPIFGQLVDFYCNGAKIGSDVTSFNGTATCIFTPNEKGNFTILVKSAAGNEYYNPSNTTATLVVGKYRTELKMLRTYGQPGKKVIFFAYLTDAVTGKAIPNMKIHFHGIMQEYLGGNFTDSMGYARFTYTVPDKKNGTYNITSDFEGNEDYNFISVTQLFQVGNGRSFDGYSIF